MDSIKEAIEAIKAGQMVVVVDDEDRENEGDLLMAADKVTPEAINFMVTYGRGLVCVPITSDHANRLGLQRMVEDNTDPRETAFTVSIDLKTVATGISAYERAETIQAMLSDKGKPEDFSKPGHIFPLVAKAGGVLERDGHTEAAVTLAKLAGCKPAGVICEIINDNGTMSRMDDLELFASKHNLKLVSIHDLINYVKENAVMEHITCALLPTEHGIFQIRGYQHPVTGEEHVALVMGDVSVGEDAIVRIHSECLTGDAFGSRKCDCGSQLEQAMARIAAHGKGVIVYLKQEGRGIGLINKIKAYALQDEGLDTVDANLALGLPEDLRRYEVAGHILRDLNVNTFSLLTNNPDKVTSMINQGFSVKQELLVTPINSYNAEYMATKAERMGHQYEWED